MLYTIENECLRVTISDVGAQMMSVRTRRDGHEYLWQADPAYWTGRAYNLFPTVGRMYKGEYEYRGEVYRMPLHGLIRKSPMQARIVGKNSVSFTHTENETTMKAYPFRFCYKIVYTLAGNHIGMRVLVRNTDCKTIHFGVGGHPGFFVPMEEGLAFEDYYVYFEDAGEIRHSLMSDDVLYTGESPLYPLPDNRLALRHSLFPVDALVLEGTGGKAAIQTDKGSRRVILSYPDMNYLGIWHKGGTDAPFICLEPWSILPASAGKRDDFETKPDMTHLPAGETYENYMDLEIL